MVFRQAARQTECFQLQWPDWAAASELVEDDAPDIGAFLLRIGHPLHTSCQAGTIEGATYYVTRLFDYHRHDRNYALALGCSTVVRHTADGRVIGVCMVGGGGDNGLGFGVYDIVVDPPLRSRGLGTNMLKRALSVLADHAVPELHLWRNDDARAASLYDRLGFTLTGLVE